MFQNPYLNNFPGYQGYQANQFNQPISLTRVTGLDGAKAYQMAPNSTAALFDANEDLMYIKSTDGAGFPTIRIFRFTEVREPAAVPAGDFISRQEFEDFKQEVLNYGKQFISAEQRTAEPDAGGYGYGEGKGPETGVPGGVSAKKR